MKKTLISLAVLTAAGVVAGAAVLYAGAINVAADEPHHPLTYRLLEFARERSIAVRASELKPPGDLADPERVRRGSGNYDAMCVGCHLSPGVEDSEIRKGLYPVPPRLADKPAALLDPQFAQARQFWIIKHGIKASGMPAWSKGGMEDEAIWDLVAFVQKLPGLTAADYRVLVAASEGHSHGGLDGHHDGHDEDDHDHDDADHHEDERPVVPSGEKKGHTHPPGFKHRH
ncbi:cytochrome c [Zoogloea sp. LCSB751]|uniref:c-type cytochrome n=1 Tax=Zoogloea sp. LCSB751 TaxID=1965277 RepID=UPI0009A548DF|nr:cytochrome c [Zoogloea sp. LCSB751]